MKEFTINGNPLADYTVVMPTTAGYDYGVVTSRINDLADMVKTANNRTNVDVIREDYQPTTEYEIIIGNAARDGVTADLAESSYIVAASGTRLYVNGGSENALGAALEALMNRIRLGNPIHEKDGIEGAYIPDAPDAKLINPALTVLEEDFDTDVEPGGMECSDNPYFYFFKRTPLNFFLGIRTEGTWNAALSGENICASESKLIFDAERARKISFTRAGKTDTRNAYVGAELRGQFFTYGYAEIYAKMDVCSGVCPAFWLLTPDGEPYYEIDVFECLGVASKDNGMIKSSLLTDEEKDGKRRIIELRARYEVKTGDGYKALGDDKAEWEKCYFDGYGNDGRFHKYAVEWTEDFIYFLYDDVRVMRTQLKEGEFSGAMCPILTLYSGVNVHDWKYETGSPEGVTEEEWEKHSSFEIEYMKVYSKQFR